MPHIDSAYNLARWLAKNEHDAQDIVQDSFVRAFTYFGSFYGNDGKAWLLAIVRNTFYSWIQKKKSRQGIENMEELSEDHISSEETPDLELETKDDQEAIRSALHSLPLEFREVIVLRELEGFSYKEIASLMQIPIGTVMSRLARGREMLRKILEHRLNMEF